MSNTTAVLIVALSLGILALALGGCASFDRSIQLGWETKQGDNFTVKLGAPEGYSK